MNSRQKGDAMEWHEVDTEALARKVRVSPGEIGHMLDALRAQGLTAGRVEVLVMTMLAMRDYAHGTSDEAGRDIEHVKPPADWQLFSHEVYEQYRAQQRRILGLFGLDAPLRAPQQLHSLVDEWNGYEDGAMKYLDLPHVSLDGHEFGDDYVEVWGGPGNKAPLYQLAALADEIAAREDISPADAVSFLMFDTEAPLPWITVHGSQSSAANRLRVTLEIGTAEARPDEVADAYASFVERRKGQIDRLTAAWQREGMPTTERPEYTRSRTTRRMAAMVLFVDAWKRAHGIKRSEHVPRGKWPEITDGFNAMYATVHKPFTPDNMRKQYQKEKGADDA